MRVRARPPQFVACLVVSIAAAGAFRVETSNLTARLQVPRSGHQATLLGDGRVLVTGGSDDRGMAIGVAEMFGPLTGVWTSAAANLVPRLGHSASLLHDGRVIVVGGLPFASACEPIGSAELYDASTDRWSMTSKIPVPVGLGTAVVSLKDGRVLVSGGGSGCGDVYSSAALFDPSSNTWSRAASMASAAQFHVTALLEDGRALVSGASTSTYDAATATWAPLGDPRPLITAACEGDAQTYSRALRPDSVLARATPDNCPSVTVLPAGTLLVAGGQTAPDSAVQWVRLSDLATGEELPTWPMQVARMGHTATRLTNGAVLIAGGRDGDRRIASSELYIPRLAFEASLFGIPRGGSDPLGDYSYGEYLATATNSRDHLLISSTGGSGVATHLIEWDPWPWWEGPAARHRPGYRRFPHLRALGPGLPDLNSIRVDERDNIWGVSSTRRRSSSSTPKGRCCCGLAANTSTVHPTSAWMDTEMCLSRMPASGRGSSSSVRAADCSRRPAVRAPAPAVWIHRTRWP